MASREILPCPFCGPVAGNVPRVIERRARNLGAGRYHYSVRHPLCGAEAGHSLTPDGAIDNWNRRPSKHGVCERHCSTCEGQDHHWLPAVSDNGEAVYRCKHCPAETNDDPDALATSSKGGGI